mmetsp:Transcript_10119/g.22402  ORF Transcript_10119/g.22402 Transcript_10119/m.22402 type:complete len:166 (+) Transcript_10119:144-641(+)
MDIKSGAEDFVPEEPLLCQALYQVPDLGGRLAELLWERAPPPFEFVIKATFPDEEDTEDIRISFESSSKRRRVDGQNDILQFLKCSAAVQEAGILGIKERRRFAEGRLTFDNICTTVRRRWPNTWHRLRPLQMSKTCDEDAAVALEVLDLHCKARPLTQRIKIVA